MKAKDLVGKTYTEAYSSLGLESYLDSKTGHHLIRDVPEAETVLGIYEALQPENSSQTLTQKYSSLKTLADYVSNKFNGFRHSKTAAVLAAGSMVTAAAVSAITKDLMPHHPGIIMDAAAQNPDDANDGVYKITKLTNDIDEIANLPRISGDFVVINYPQSDEAQVYNLHNGTTGSRFPLIDTWSGSRPADIDDGNLVFITQQQNQDTKTWLTNLSAAQDTIQIDSTAAAHNIVFSEPKIVVAGANNNELYISSNSGGVDAIIRYHGGETLLNPDIFVEKNRFGYPDGSGTVVFEDRKADFNTGGADILAAGYSEDFQSIVQYQVSPRNDDGCWHRDPAISDKNIVWSYTNGVSGNCKLGDGIYIFDTDSQGIKDNLIGYQPESLEIYGDNLVWTETFDGIYIHNISTDEQIRIPSFGDYPSQVDIWKNKVVWSDDGEVYLAEFSFDGLDNSPPDPIPKDTTIEDLVKFHTPTYLFSKDEKYSPVDPYADDGDVTNNVDNWEKNEFPNDQVIYYAVTDYSNKFSVEHPEGFKVIQYWSHYVYNDWGTDQHKYDWEVIHKWVDNKNGEVFYTSSSMHLWDNKYQENIDRFFVEEGGHGMSKDAFMIDHIEMSFNGVEKVSDKNSYELRPLIDLLKYNIDSGFPGERGKFPTDQERFYDPDAAIRLNNLETIVSEFKIKNSPELLVIADGRSTGLTGGKTLENIPNSNYIENEERVIIIGDHKDVKVVLTGTKDEKYELEERVYNNGAEKTFTKTGTIKDGEIKKLDITNIEIPDTNNASPGYTPLMVAAAIGGGALPILYLMRNKKSGKINVDKTIPKASSHRTTAPISELMKKHKKSEGSKTRTLPEECLEEEHTAAKNIQLAKSDDSEEE